MDTVRLAKTAFKDAFPAIWLEWHFLRRPKSAEVELRYLKSLIPQNAVTIDVGANCGLYTRELARVSACVHAFEPTRQMADLLRRTSAANVRVHEVAASDHDGMAMLSVPFDGAGAVHSLASIEPRHDGRSCASVPVQTARLDGMIKDDVAFIKIDVEGHELAVLNGSTGLIERSQPVFLVEAEERHAQATTASVFDFFARHDYQGFFVMGGEVAPVAEFDPHKLQDIDALLPNGGRKEGRFYINNFFFFPPHLDGMAALS
jgi:FkbM family methyltransferase